MHLSGLTPATATRGGNTQAVASPGKGAHLARQPLTIEPILTRRARAAAVQAPGPDASALGQQGKARLCEKLKFANQSVAAAVNAPTAATAPQRIARHPQRVMHFQALDRGI